MYGDAAPLLDVLSAGLAVIARSRAYHLLDLEAVKRRLMCAPDYVSTHPESGMTRALYDCPSVPLTAAGPEVRLVVATHPAADAAPTVGVERGGTVYELFVSTLPFPAFTASDVLDLYLHRGSFETVLADEDDEQDSDRWYSHTPCGKAVCSHFGPVGLEPASGVGTGTLSIGTAHDRICSRSCSRTGKAVRACGPPGVFDS